MHEHTRVKSSGGNKQLNKMSHDVPDGFKLSRLLVSLSVSAGTKKHVLTLRVNKWYQYIPKGTNRVFIWIVIRHNYTSTCKTSTTANSRKEKVCEIKSAQKRESVRERERERESERVCVPSCIHRVQWIKARPTFVKEKQRKMCL